MMEPMLYHKTIHQRKLDAQAADFIKKRLPYRAKIELRIPKHISVVEEGAWKEIAVPNYVYGTITNIDHVTVTLEHDSDAHMQTIDFKYIQKILPYEAPKD